MTDEQKEQVLKSYIDTALWSTTNESNDEIEFLNGEFTIDDFDPDTLNELEKEMWTFIDEYYGLVCKEDEDTTYEMFVHNFWLNRNGHGAGFWDKDYKNKDALSDASEKFGTVFLYVGDDARIYS